MPNAMLVLRTTMQAIVQPVHETRAMFSRHGHTPTSSLGPPLAGSTLHTTQWDCRDHHVTIM